MCVYHGTGDDISTSLPDIINVKFNWTLIKSVLQPYHKANNNYTNALLIVI